MAKILLSQVVKYNANTRGSNVGDCTTRAISLAFNMDYGEVRKIQNASAKANRIYPFNALDNCKKVISKLGGGSMITPSERITVGEFADTHSGTYILFCGKYENSNRRTHLVCIINDRIYDSWDSSSRFVKGYWEITSGITADAITDIQPYLKSHFITERDLNWYINYTSPIFNKIIDNNRKLAKLRNSIDFEVVTSLRIDKIKISNYTFKFAFTFKVEYPGEDIKTQIFDKNFAITFKPTMHEDEVDPYFDKVFYSKFTSAIYILIDKIVDTCSGYELTRSLPETSLNLWSTSEQKSFKSLPYWVQRLAVSFSMDSYSYYDKVRLKMYRAPFDNEYGSADENKIVFEADSMSTLREILENYRHTGDYEQSYNIRYRY